MKRSIFIVLVIILGCQPQNKNGDKNLKVPRVSQNEKPVSSSLENKAKEENLVCNEEVCLLLRNHDESKKSFDIFISNSVKSEYLKIGISIC